MGKLHNLVSIILYDERRLRPDTLKAISEAVKEGVNGAMIPTDPATLGSFQQLIFFQPEVDRLLDQKLGKRETEAQKNKRERKEKSAETQRAIDDAVGGS